MFHSLRLAATATLAVAVPVFAYAQVDLTGAPTPTRPIAQPSFTAPASATPRFTPPGPPLPSGSYILTIHFPPHGSTSGPTEVDTVALTNSGGSLTMTYTPAGAPPQSFTGRIDAGGGFQVSERRAAAALWLDGSAVGTSAQGSDYFTGHNIPSEPRGGFTLAPAP